MYSARARLLGPGKAAPVGQQVARRLAGAPLTDAIRVGEREQGADLRGLVAIGRGAPGLARAAGEACQPLCGFARALQRAAVDTRRR